MLIAADDLCRLRRQRDLGGSDHFRTVGNCLAALAESVAAPAADGAVAQQGAEVRVPAGQIIHVGNARDFFGLQAVVASGSKLAVGVVGKPIA